MRLRARPRPLIPAGIAVVVAVAVAVPASAAAPAPAVASLGPAGARSGPADGSAGAVVAPTTTATPLREARKPTKKKPGRKQGKRKRQGRAKAKQEKTTASVGASWTVTRSDELRGGVESEKLTVSVKNGTATFADDTARNAKGTADVSITYEATYATDDRSWHLGCDRERRTSTATYNEKDRPIWVYATNRRTVDGKEQRLANGWAIEIAWPSVRRMGYVTTGFFEDWESIAMQNCLTTPITVPLGHWSPTFVPTLGVTGRLNGGGKGVLLTHAQTSPGQTGQADGRISFSESVEKR